MPLDHLAALPDPAWTTHALKRPGRYRHPQIHEQIVHLGDIDAPIRQIAVRNIGHEEPTLLITIDYSTPAKDLFARYAERMIIENKPTPTSPASTSTPCPREPLNVDLDTTLTVLAGNCYRLLARKLPRYQLATPDRLWRHFLDATVTVTDDHVRVDLALRTYPPVLIDAGFLDIPIPGGVDGDCASDSRPADPAWRKPQGNFRPDDRGLCEVGTRSPWQACRTTRPAVAWKLAHPRFWMKACPTTITSGAVSLDAAHRSQSGLSRPWSASTLLLAVFLNVVERLGRN